MNSKTIPEKQSKLAICPLGQGCKGLVSCNFTIFIFFRGELGAQV